jgi:CRP-like cAMP-binding protein
MDEPLTQAIRFCRNSVLRDVPHTLLARARVSNLAAGSVVFRSGERPDFVHLVLDGEVRLVRHSRRGQDVVLQSVRSGFFAEASVEFRKYHCDAIAPVASVVLHFPIRDFMAHIDADARFRRAWVRHLAGEVRRLRARCERLSLRRAADRIVHYIETEGTASRVEFKQSMKNWALELGLTHEALYRALAKLRRARRLSVKGSWLELISPPIPPRDSTSSSARRDRDFAPKSEG